MNTQPPSITAVTTPARDGIAGWLKESDAARLAELWQLADSTRQANVGDDIHLRGLIEISNHCARRCGYCGLRAGNRGLERYRMTESEIIDCAHQALSLGYGTVVLQAGEDYGITAEWLSAILRRIKRETGLAVTLSLGEREESELKMWRNAGADRYLLRFETSDENFYRRIHPPIPGKTSDRVAQLLRLRQFGYEIGSGVMVGIPGQTYASLINDILLFRELDLDMIGIGPYIPHPATPLGNGTWAPTEPVRDQVPNDELTVYKVVALARLACPQANIPSTTALATINQGSGRELGLKRGANVVMPNLTPARYRELYEIYPGKACAVETADECRQQLAKQLKAIGRHAGTGAGGRRAT